jgi:hypothetical protein
MRALDALGLALAQDEPDPQWLQIALAWQQHAQGGPAPAAGPWTPCALAGEDARLRRRLELLAEVAGPDRNTSPGAVGRDDAAQPGASLCGASYGTPAV